MVGEVACSAVLPGVAESVHRARDEIRAALSTDHPILDTVLLIVSELVTNSIRHSRSSRDRTPYGRVAVDVVELPGGSVRVEVVELSGEGVPTLKPPNPDMPGGCGLFLVDQITGGDWGWEDHGPLRTVWAQIRL